LRLRQSFAALPGEVSMSRERKKLTLGQGAAFLNSRLKRLPQENDVWEADFRVLPKPLSQNETHYLGLVVVQREGSILAEEQIEHTPDVNDLATLLAHAMRRPLTGRGHRPKRIRVRKNPRWPELFPHLEELSVAVVVDSDLDTLRATYHDHLRRVREARRARMIKPTAEQARIEKLFPAVAQWVRDGHIEIGDQESFGFVARALDYGGQVFEDDRPNTLAEALAVLEQGLREWYAEEGIELDEPG
jgi:hypothetical protein